MFFDVAASFIFSALALYALIKHKGFILAVIVACDYVLSGNIATALNQADLFGGDASFYAWYLLYGGLRLAIAFSLAGWFIHADGEKPTAYASLIYFLYSIACLLIIVQYIPAGGVYPFEFLGVYENYETLHYAFTVLLLFCILSRTGITGNAKRIFTNRGSKLGDSNILHSGSVSANQGCSKVGDDC